MYELSIPHLSPKLLPSPEPISILEEPSYAIARKLFTLAPALIIVGYSFGRQHDSFDDLHSFEYLADLLTAQPVPTFVLSPTPDELVETLRDRLSSYNVFGLHVFGLPLRWELFSAILLANSHPTKGLRAKWCGKQLNELLFKYEYSLDAQ